MEKETGLSSLKIHNITECSICLETFKEPKVLPCIHTFCLQCLDSYCANKKPDEMSCPLCRKVFSIPTGGIKEVPNNIFIQQLIQINNSTASIGAEKFVKTTSCELCSDSEEKTPSTSYCIECDQHICDRCSATHKKANVSRSHQVVHDVADIPSVEERLRLKVTYCDQHSSEQIRLYCYDCKMIMCLKCIVNEHSQHKLTDVNYSAENFRQQLHDDVCKMSAFTNSKQLQLTQLEEDKNSFLEKVASAESEIAQKYDQLMSLLQSHRSQLMKELNHYKDKVVKEIENKTDEIERLFVIAESFKRYCLEVINKGTACDISRTADDLHTRAEELVKTQDEHDCRKFSDVGVTLDPFFPSTDSVKNIIGELVLNGEAVCLTTFLNKPTLLHVMPSSGKGILGLTVLGGDVFVVRDTSQVEVYTSESLCFARRFVITGSTNLLGIASCSHYNCLYISDYEQNKVYSYDVSNNAITSWPLSGSCYGLSVTKCYSVLVTLYDRKQIQEYSPRGWDLIRSINLDPSIDNPRHCVQLSTGNYVVSNSGFKQHRICIVDKNGHIIQSHDGFSGSNVQRNLNNPRTVCVDAYDNVLVADRDNNRVRLLSPSLTYLGEIVIPGHQLTQPCALSLDTSTYRLYIGNRIGAHNMYVLAGAGITDKK